MIHESRDQKQRRRRLSAAAITMGVLAVSACGNGSGGGSTNNGGGGLPKTVKIGLIANLSGDGEAFGKDQLNGLKAGLAYLSATGRTNGVKYDLVTRDAAGDPAKAIAAVRELAGKGVHLIAGDEDPDVLEAEQATINQVGAVSLAVTQSNVLGEAGSDKKYPWIFATGWTTDMNAEIVAKYVASGTDKKVVAQINDDSGYALSQGAAVSAAFKKYEPGISVRSEKFTSTATDVTAQLRRLQHSGADSLMIWTTTPGPLLSVFKGLATINWAPKISTVSIVALPQVRSAIPSSLLKNTVAGPLQKSLLTSGGGSSQLGAATQAYFKYYAQTQGKSPSSLLPTDLLGVYSFDLAVVANAAVQAAHSTDGKALRDALERGVTMTGAGGTYSFSSSKRVGLDTSELALEDNSKPCSGAVCALAPGS